MRNRSSLKGYRDHILLCVLNAFADCIRHLGSLTKAIADMAFAVAYDHDCRKSSNAATFDGLGYTVDRNQRFLELHCCGIEFVFHVYPPSPQNFSPPSRAPSASSSTLPW